MNLMRTNIESLVSLWQKVVDRHGGYTSGVDSDYCLAPDGQWPNRLWFHQDIEEKKLKAAKTYAESLASPPILPYWDIYQNPAAHSLLEASRFRVVSEQVGMYLELEGIYPASPEVELAALASQAAALQWEELFRSAFGYRNSHKLLWPGHPRIRPLIAYYKKQPIGTAMLYDYPSGVVGIHAVGIIPAMHRQGLGEKLMRNLLRQAKTEGFRYTTLQASQAGLGLYLKLGFQSQFRMKNYALQK